MLRRLSRRLFLALSGGALVARSLPAENDIVPPVLDHILLGCNDLASGVDFVAQRTGVRAAFGGVHPGRGTQNALLSLGDRHYLEIIAPDPEQQASGVSARVNPSAPGQLAQLKALTIPRLVGWAAHPGDLNAFAKKLRDAGVAFVGPTPGSRMRPDGRVLRWQTLNLENDDAGLLPFFIQWSEGSPHPASDAPKGCRIDRFELITPDPASLKKPLALFSLDVASTKGEKPQLRAAFSGAKGGFEITS